MFFWLHQISCLLSLVVYNTACIHTCCYQIDVACTRYWLRLYWEVFCQNGVVLSPNIATTSSLHLQFQIRIFVDCKFSCSLLDHFECPCTIPASIICAAIKFQSNIFYADPKAYCMYNIMYLTSSLSRRMAWSYSLPSTCQQAISCYDRVAVYSLCLQASAMRYSLPSKDVRTNCCLSHAYHYSNNVKPVGSKYHRL